MTTQVGPRRAAAVLLALTVTQSAIWYCGAALAGTTTVLARGCSLALGVFSAGLLASLGEWAVHRYSMHTPWRNQVLNVPYALHHSAHHWYHYTPDRFTHAGPVKYHPTHDPKQVCATNAARAWVAVQQYVFYTFFGIVFLFVPAWIITENVFYLLGLVPSILWVCTMFVHVHNVTHHPGRRFMERFRWFHFLKHHHYIHHIDTGCNVNFLLPLCDLLFGTLRTRLTPKEIERWGSYEQALARVVPVIEAGAG